MSRKNIIIGIIICIASHNTFAQNISGKVIDNKNQPLDGTTVVIEKTKSGTITNLNGNFYLKNRAKGNFRLITSCIGFKTDTTFISVGNKDLNLVLTLYPSPKILNEVILQADKIVERTSISNISFSKKDLRTSQGLIEDPLRTLASLPGIGRGGDLFSPSAFYVRGGDPSENLFLLDNNKIHFPYYFGGQKSIFNTDITERIELLTGGFSAMYGNHMSSVLNVTTRDGNMNKLNGMLSLGFYNASGIIEGPIKKNQTSFLVAVRRTYLDLFLKESAEFPVPSFGDVSYKLTHIINDDHKISLSGISSDELLDYLVADPTPGLPNKLETAGNNHFQTLQLHSKFSDKIYNKLSLTNALSNSKAEVGNNLDLDINAWQAGVRNDLSYYLSHKSKIRMGIEWQYGTYNFNGTFPLDPLQTDPNDTTIVLQEQNIDHKGEAQRSAYVLYEGVILPKLGVNAGMRWDYNSDNKYSDFSPRLSLNYQLSENSKLRAAAGIYKQFPGVGITADLKSEEALHYIVGYEYKFSQNIYGWIEGYLKEYSSLIIYDNQFSFSNNGKGTAKGIELFFRKEKGIINGWVSYALSHSQRTVPLGIEIKDFAFDQRHIFNLVTQYHIKSGEEKEKWYKPVLLHSNIRYTDGTPFTPTIGAEHTARGWVPIQGDALSERNSDYLNINLRIEWIFTVGKKKHIGTFFMEAWNLLSKKNILGRNYQYGTEYPNNVKVNKYFTSPFLMAGGFRIEFGKQE